MIAPHRSHLPTIDRLAAIRLPLLITGVAGVTGYNALPYFRSRLGDGVIGVRPTCNARLCGPGIYPCDLEDPDQVAALFDRYRFATILHCGGNCALKSCELDPQMAWRVNVLGLRNLLERIGDRPARIVVLSSDLVFSGTGNGGHSETDPVDPVTVYGRTMVEAEELTLGLRPDALVLRISLPMGPSFNGHAGAIDWIDSRFRKHRPATLYFDEVRTPTYTEEMNRALEALLGGTWSGIYHFGGPRRLSLFQIAQIVNRVGGYPPELLRGCPRIQAGPMPPRAGDVSMRMDKLIAALGADPFGPWPRHPKLIPEDRRWHFERCEQFSAGRPPISHYLYRDAAVCR